jgi:UDP-N-acetylglucosamine 2-epimerase (non-hydrolysing)
MDKVFFDQLELPKPKYNLDVGSSNPGKQTANMLMGITGILQEEKPGMVLVEGDTNTVLAGALAAVKLGIRVAHVEAGLRSYDLTMPEEINRRLTDHCSDLLFAPTTNARHTLISEQIAKEKIFVTGNTIVDAVLQNIEISKKADVHKTLGTVPMAYFLATIHRQENVDNPKRLRNIVEGLARLSRKLDVPVILPIHPRSKKQLKTHDITASGITLVEPLDYLSFLQLESDARLILTDSGGVQEEACILHVPCVTLRYNTERQETLEVGCNILAGTDPRTIISKAKLMLSKKRRWRNPYGDGRSGARIVDILIRKSGVSHLARAVLG